MNGIQEVSGSIPLISTKKRLISYEIRCFCNFFGTFIFPVHNACIIEVKKGFLHFSKIAIFATFPPLFEKKQNFLKNFFESYGKNIPLLKREGGCSYVGI